MTTDLQKGIRSTQLTREEPEVDNKEPWKDDKLQRQRAADALANLVKAQRGPFVISLDGDWGTGKTFFLKRWKQQLENDKIRVIYFNAWQDDFLGDPLVPMLAQIMDSVGTRPSQRKANSTWRTLLPWCRRERRLQGDDVDIRIRKRISESARSLAYRNVQGLTNKFVGVTLPDFGDNIIKAYRHQDESRNRLREALGEMSKSKQSQFPLVFIVDELDRCRPDFAIATLERTKHMFDIPGLVFVYGVNRRELCKSIASVYGAIDTDAYFRRFFDMDFTLPGDDRRRYCEYLAEYYDIPAHIAAARLPRGGTFVHAVPTILTAIDSLSLRDIEQCIRIAGFIAINLAHGKSPLHYRTIIAVIVIRLMNSDLYRRFTNGDHVAGEMIDWLAGRVTASSSDQHWLILIQAPLYAMCDEGRPKEDAVVHQFERFRQDRGDDHVTLLAESTKNLSDNDYSSVLSKLQQYSSDAHWRPARTELVELMELAAAR